MKTAQRYKLRSYILQLVVVGGALWPVGIYLARAYTAGSDGWLPALLLLGVVSWALWKGAGASAAGGEPPRPTLTVPALLLLYAALYGLTPPLARALLGLLVLAALLLAWPGLSWRRHSAIPLLLLLSVPAVDTLNFFLGGPLRAASAQLSALWLLIGGVPAHAEGAMIRVGAHLFSIDAPCSGVNGLWSAVVAAAVLALWRELRPTATLALVTLAAGLAVVSNAWRAATLIYASRIIHGQAAEIVHPFTGLVGFAAVLALLVWLSGRLPSSPPATSSRVRGPRHDFGTARRRLLRPSIGLGCAVLAALAPLVSHPSLPTRQGVVHFSGWPQDWMGQSLHRLPPTPLDERWIALSAGPLARFQLTNGNELLLRWVERPGRGVHPPEDCYRAQGYTVTSLDMVLSPAPGALGLASWRRFRAVKGAEDVEVREIIVSQTGQSYSDPAWWWWCVAGPGATDRGPWWFAVEQRGIAGLV